MNGNILQLVYAQLAFYTSLCHSKRNLAYNAIAHQEEKLNANFCLWNKKKSLKIYCKNI